jgi:hypothetical protein
LLEQSGSHQTVKISSSETLKLSSSSSWECSFKSAYESINKSNLPSDNDEVYKDVTEGNLIKLYITAFTFIFWCFVLFGFLDFVY